MVKTNRFWAYAGSNVNAVRKNIKHRKLMQQGILQPLTKDELRKLALTATQTKHNDGSTNP